MLGQGLKQRLLGAVVLIGILVLLAPALFRGGESHPLVKIELEPLASAPEVPVFVEDLETAPEEVKVVEREEPPAKLGQASEQIVPGVDQEGHLKAWSLQLASFSDQSNASSLVNKLKDMGHAAYSRPFIREGGSTLYRVYIGPEVRSKELLELRGVLQKELGLTGILVRFKP